jgi:hypothetical protein
VAIKAAKMAEMSAPFGMTGRDTSAEHDKHVTNAGAVS